MYVLKDTNCPDCFKKYGIKSDIKVIRLEDTVDRGECLICHNRVGLPTENYYEFVEQNCKHKRGV